MPTTDEPTRRQPRGLQRIEEILDAAELVFAEEGYDAATTNRVAARAGISPGSLYQYFDNKKALAEALGRRYVELLDAEHGDILDPALAALPLTEMVDRVVDPMVAFNLDHPAAKALLSGGDLSPELAEATKELNDRLCGGVERLIAARATQLGEADRRLAAEVTVSIYAGLIPSIVAARGRERTRRVAGLKAALTGYWSSFEP